MRTFSQLVGIAKRILRGEDVILISQDASQWNRQFQAGRWDRLVTNQPNTDTIARILLEEVMDREDQKAQPSVLDVGCGNGGLAKSVGIDMTRIQYLGIDISDTAIQKAQLNLPNARFRVCDATNPSTDLGSFDIFIFNEVLYYINPLEVLPRYALLARPDATVIISVIRSWRTPFIWQRIRSRMNLERTFSVDEIETSRCWDIAVGSFRAFE